VINVKLLTGVKMDGSEKRRIRLIQIMDRLKINNKTLASRCGLHTVSISRLCTGESRLIDIETLEKLALGLGVHICYFFIDDDENLDLLQQAATILKDKTDASSQLGSSITSLYQLAHKPIEHEVNGDLRKEVGEIKSMLQRILNGAPPPKPNFPKAAPK
jgi:transcriptional regulator with XRE-family HTH domain